MLRRLCPCVYSSERLVSGTTLVRKSEEVQLSSQELTTKGIKL